MRARICRDAWQHGGARVEIESQGRRIVIEAMETGSRAGIRVADLDRFENRTATAVGPFSITPFLMEGSPGDAYAVLVEADGAALLYAGDLQPGIVQKFLEAPPQHVDALLMDAAIMGRDASPDAFPTEEDFEEKFVDLFRQTRGLALVWCSRQNVDRIATIYRACLRTNRQFIVDISTADVLRAPFNRHVAQGIGDRIRVFVSANQLRKITREEAPALREVSAASRIHPEELTAVASSSAMLFRPNIMPDLDTAKCLAGARLIFSMWLGYLEYEKANPVLEWLDRHGIPLDQCHATGHAGIMELIKLRQAFGTAPVVPIRSRQPGRFDELFGGIERRADGEWWDIMPTRPLAEG